jgi:GNAT superfamily N-acetyltransferase
MVTGAPTKGMTERFRKLAGVASSLHRTTEGSEFRSECETVLGMRSRISRMILNCHRPPESGIADLPGRVIDSTSMHSVPPNPSAVGLPFALAGDHQAAASVIITISPSDEEARALMQELDAEIAALYPGSVISGIDEAEFEKSGGYFVIAQQGNRTIGCGGFRPVDEECAEIKRMFVRPDVRRRGGARQILRHLQEEVHRRGFRSTVLETGCDNAGAIALYESEGYLQIPEFPGCLGIPVSRCYIKRC